MFSQSEYSSSKNKVSKGIPVRHISGSKDIPVQHILVSTDVPVQKQKVSMNIQGCNSLSVRMLQQALFSQ
jgi:hypothetical protein